jgi:hypothetical protein
MREGMPKLCRESTDDSQPVQPLVKLPLRRVFPLLTFALQNDLRWLDDFSEEEIAVSPDLADVLIRFEALVCRKSA